MRTFPAEFSSLLSAKGRRHVTSATRVPSPYGPRPALTLKENIFDPSTARACIRILDRHLYPLLQRMQSPIPADSISRMTVNYGESLPKTLRMKTCHLHSKHCVAYPQAQKINLIPMLRSESLRKFAEASTGLKLANNACQAICYEHGDYAGPHNDHHPEDDNTRKGFVDVHIMLSNSAVDHHWLVYERGHHLTEIRNVAVESGIAIYKLPFWHYTTPLAGKRGREKQARRWLLLASYDIL